MKCPKCGKETEGLRALSRVDNKTMICDECGTKEALDAAGLTEGSSIRSAILDCIGRDSTPQEEVKAYNDVPETNVGKITNADRIRSMSDEDLLDFLCSIETYEEGSAMTIGNSVAMCSVSDVEDWLQSESEG